MNEVVFNVLINEPNQLVHTDFRNQEKGFLIFAHFQGDYNYEDDSFLLYHVVFYVEEVDIKDSSQSAPKRYHEIDISSFEYHFEHVQERTQELMKQICFNFKNKETSYPQMQSFINMPYIEVKRGDKLDFRIEGVGFDPPLKNENQTINSHICNIKFIY